MKKERGFAETAKLLNKYGLRLECPYGCVSYGYLCNGDPATTTCGLSDLVDVNYPPLRT